MGLLARLFGKTNPALDLNAALTTLTVDAVKAHASSFRERVDADGEFLKLMAELKVSSAARTLGKKGGHARQAKARAQRTGVCRVCNHDSLATASEIRYHMAGHPGRMLVPGVCTSVPCEPKVEAKEAKADDKS